MVMRNENDSGYPILVSMFGASGHILTIFSNDSIIL
jgi:hypothetical protein